ncbi:regulatory solute carrier protein family 1 member 1 isoform X2 [Sciurus carolinensis]|uniref:regulatory solute carrier protein family 1 member 1 isoform X2 n=1 Tax=Sciurus carolinensis TaxID=30640 RepID=UPI001FB2BF14|nr:regulatory solute carrier protein family 1 member 1 isoform X2 [Sciurus carolinensis]
MWCVCCSWSGPRPDKSGKESTSLGMSSLSTSDGWNHPAPSSGRSPDIGNPTSLARSVSALVCPTKPSDPDSIKPKAVKALKASAEFQINSQKKEYLPLQDLSGPASSADQCPAMPLHNSSEEAIVAGSLEKSAERSTQVLKFSLHTRQESSLSVTATRMHEPQVAVGEMCWPPENQNLSQLSSIQPHEDPEDEPHEVVQQDAPRDQVHLCDMGDLLEHPKERQQDQQTNLEATMKGDGLQQSVDLTSAKESFLPSGCFGCSDSETMMDIDVGEPSLVAVLSSAGRQKASTKSIGACALPSGCPLVQVGTSERDPSPESLNDSVSTQDSQPPESSGERSGTNNEYGNFSPSLSLCGSCEPSVESAEESCSSITAALKELHELLVISNKPASESTSEEVSCQSEKGAKGQTGIKGFSERWTQIEHLSHSEECGQASLYQARSVSVETENVGTAPETGIEGVGNTNSGGPDDGLLADKERVPKSKESGSKSSCVTITSAESSNQLHCTSGVEISSKLVAGEEDALSQTSEQTKSLPFSFILVKDLDQGVRNPITARPETRENVCPEATRPFLELEPLTSHPSSPSILPPLVFPATDIDRILRAGFTLQEALGALHRVGGNADLALLVLLAKNIVVPT